MSDSEEQGTARGAGGNPSPFELVAVSLAGSWDPAIPIGASRVGGTGILDLCGLRDPETAAAATARLLRLGVLSRCGVLVDPEDEAVASAVLGGIHEDAEIWVYAAADERTKRFVSDARRRVRRLGLVVTSSQDLAHLDLDPDIVIAKGHESGGRIAEETAFVLAQAVLAQTDFPAFVWGGIGWHTAPACRVAGAAGVILDWQLALLRESTLPPVVRQCVAGMDGSETAVVRENGMARYRILSRPGFSAFEALETLAEAGEASVADAYADRLRLSLVEDRAWPVGQDACFAASFAERGSTVGRILSIFRHHVEETVERILAADVMRPGSPMAVSQATEFPVMQGPMTRVSDVPAFLDAVERGGALAMLAPALMRRAKFRPLMEETQALMRDRPWGVGILGFVDAELRAEQMEVIREIRPPFAVIAGGRADQAAEMEALGIHTYLHVPSPAILESFLREGARRFIFEGMECGGHVGPRSSFVLWESMIRVLLNADLASDEFEKLHIYFAGGIHDTTSSLIASAIAQQLVDCGARFGVEMGTAYLFTQEAVATGAIVPAFQEMAVGARETVLFESGPGHSIRCIRNPCYDQFQDERAKLRRNRLPVPELRKRLEERHLGRLRIASKGIAREAPAPGSAVPRYVQVTDDEQRREGMYMIGQVAAVHRGLSSVADLHQRVSTDVHRRIRALREMPAITSVDEFEIPAAPPPLDVAIVGMSCLLPGAEDPETFWENILLKKNLIQEIPEDRFEVDSWFDSDPQARDKINSRWGGFVKDILFDPLKYGIPPTSIPSIEPAQLLALELVDRALRDAGAVGLGRDDPRKPRTSVILGVGGGLADLGTQYAMRSLVPRYLADADESLMSQLPEWTEDSFAGILPNVVAGRVSNRFDFGGVNFTVDAACASSLAAIYLACQELAAGTSDRVVAGGCDTVQGPFAYLCFSKAGALSADGKPRVFDRDAKGITISEGLAAVVLKRREDAVRDGDRIYALIRAVSGGSDGRCRSMTAPHMEGQLRTLERAYAQARVSPTSVALFEAHGTGTTLGDRTECLSLTELLNNSGADPKSHALGSVKSMIGHTKCTAGVAGLIKSAMALYHRVLPATLNVENPSAAGQLVNGPLYVNTETRPWIGGAEPRRAAVSAFGFGGTDFHAVLEEYTDDPVSSRHRNGHTEREAELFFICAESREVLPRRIRVIADRLRAAREAGAEIRLADLAYTHHVRRHVPERPSHRIAIVARTVEEFQDQLDRTAHNLEEDAEQGPMPSGVFYGDRDPAERGRLAFLFPGQGSQYPDMMRRLAVEFAEVNDTLSAADSRLGDSLGSPLSHYIFPPPAFSSDEAKRARQDLAKTMITQPALGACNVAMMRLLASVGVSPELAAGHSYGELTALHAAGGMSFDDLIELSFHRGRAMVGSLGETDASFGTMLAVSGDRESVAAAIEGLEGVWIANTNSPRQTVISGTTESVARAAEALQSRSLSVAPIPVQCAFHTPLMAAARDQFEEALARVAWRPTRFEVFGTATAAPYPPERSAIAGQLLEQLVSPVRFREQIEAMYEAGARTFLEVGPNLVLTKLVREILGDRSHFAFHTGSRAADGFAEFLNALGELSVAGHPVCLNRLYEGRECALVDLATLAARSAEAPVPHHWLVNSAYSRRASEPRRTPKPLARMNEAPLVGAPGPLAPRPAAATPPPLATPRAAAPARSIPPAPASPAPAAPAPSRAALAPPSPVSPAAAPPAAARPQQPAGAYEVFLRAQETLRKVLDSQESILQAYFGESNTAALPERVADRRALGAESIARPEPPAREPWAVAALPPAAPVAPPAAAPTHSPAASAPVAQGRAEALPESTLIEIISERTGYPPDVLDLEVDLEAELGIDSIKRVEIIAAFRRAVIPQMEEPTTEFMDAMSEARSMKEILAGVAPFLQPSANRLETSAGRGATAAPPVEPVARAVDLAAELVRIVSERTGYPADMLGLDVDMEADLGIDSIKRVEIIAAFRRSALPEMNEPTSEFMDAMSEARTMQEILDGIRSFVDASAAPAEPKRTDTVTTAVPVIDVPAIDVREELVRIVSERTGYPPDMLDLDIDMEADLGIDSIKKVEIIAAFRRVAIPEMSEPTPEFMDAVSGVRTMQEMLDAFGRILVDSSASTKAPPPARPPATARTPRSIVEAVELPINGRPFAPPTAGVILITEDGRGSSGSLRSSLEACGAATVALPLGGLEDAVELTAAVEAARAQGRIVGAVHLTPIRPVPDFTTRSRTEWLQAERAEVRGLLFLTQALAPELAASSNGAFLLATLSTGGGTLPADCGAAAAAPWRGGIAGFMKCAALEWPEARIRALDLSLDVPFAEMGEILLREWNEPGAVEIGYRDGRRYGLRAVEAPLPVELPKTPSVQLGEDSVVLVTGGARGITAEVVKEFAEQSRATFILIARTRMPNKDESPETSSARSARELRGVVAAKMKAERSQVTGKEVEAEVQTLLREREVRETLSAIRAAGGKAEYIVCDVSDSDAFRAVIADVARTHGRIDAVIHGAGIIEDKLIVDKSAASFERVMRTKIDPLLTLIEAVPRDTLKAIVLFTSVAGFFGNRGQSDYAAANEILNRLGEDLRRRWGIKVICLNWGPWEGTGMVSGEVAAQFRSRGIDLIAVDQGRRAVWEELCHSTNSDVRIILGPGPWVVSAGEAHQSHGQWQEGAELRVVGLERLRS